MAVHQACTITRVRYLPGDDVFGLASGIASLAITDARLLCKKPILWSHKEASTMPVASAPAALTIKHDKSSQAAIGVIGMACNLPGESTSPHNLWICL